MALVSQNGSLVAGVTKVKPDNNPFIMMPSELGINGYDLYHSNVDADMGRGFILYIHKSLKDY